LKKIVILSEAKDLLFSAAERSNSFASLRMNKVYRNRRIMFSSHKVKIEGELLEKVKQCSDAAGYESIDEFVIHMLEKETKKILPDESSTSKEEIQKRLRGLGYIE
jgi:hypothetical protein